MSEETKEGVAYSLVPYREKDLDGAYNTAVVRVHAELLRRLPAVVIVGLSANEAKESAERVRSAFEASGVEFPRMRVLVSVLDLPPLTRAGILDLAIAVAILRAMGEMPAVSRDEDAFFLGELALDGRLRPTRGTYARVRGVDAWRNPSKRRVIVPVADPELTPTAALRGVASARTLRDVVDGATVEVDPLRAAAETERLVREAFTSRAFDFTEMGTPGEGRDMTDIAKQIAGAVAHGHGILFTDIRPGCGASMLAHRITGLIDPDLGRDVRWTNMSIAGLGVPCGIPFRAPHHTIASEGMVGTLHTLGEANLAEFGVLYLDEVELFRRDVVDALAAQRVGALRHPLARPVQLVASTTLSGRELRDRHSGRFLSLFPGVISAPEGSFRGSWPSTATIQGWISEMRSTS